MMFENVCRWFRADFAEKRCGMFQDTMFRWIRCGHEDLRAHQSVKTTSRHVMTHIHNMRAHVAVSRPRFGPIGHSPWAADHVAAAYCDIPDNYNTKQEILNVISCLMNIESYLMNKNNSTYAYVLENFVCVCVNMHAHLCNIVLVTKCFYNF